MKKVEVHEGKAPDERLGRIAGRLLEALERDPEYADDVRLVAALTEPEQGGSCMTASFGYDQETAIEDGVADLFAHLRAILAGQGVDLQLERRGAIAKIVQGKHPDLPASGAVVTVTITDRKDGITALVESKPPLPLTNDMLDPDQATNAQAAAIHMLWQIGEQTPDFDWRIVLRREQ